MILKDILIDFIIYKNIQPSEFVDVENITRVDDDIFFKIIYKSNENENNSNLLRCGYSEYLLFERTFKLKTL